MSGVAEVIASAREQGRAVVVGYLPAGYPDQATSLAAMTAMVQAGVDVVEVGVPYSDPLMDGPVIQHAVTMALRAGARPRHAIQAAGAVAGAGAPALLMTYWNVVERYGVSRFADDLVDVGAAGLIIPDLIPEEAGEWLDVADRHGLDRVFLVAPSSSEQRLRSTAQACRGFVYAASTMGVTGARERVDHAARALVERVRGVTDLPVCVGIGVSDGAQAGDVAAYADGVIVGSALVRCLVDASTPDAGVRAVGRLSRELVEAVHTARRVLPA